MRFAATKLIEGDPLILERLGLDQNEKETLEHLILQMEKERGLDRSAAIADMRFNFIERVCESTVVKPVESKERLRSERMDKVLTGKYTAIPCFVLIMLAVFYLTFNVIGAGLQSLLERGLFVDRDNWPGVDGGACEPCTAGAGNGWNFCRCRKCPEFPACDRNTVLFLVPDGRQWIHCQSGVFYG